MLVLYRQGFIVMYYYDENMELHHSFYIDDLDEWVDASTEYKTPQEVVHDLKLIGSKDQIICYNLSTINN